VADGGGGTARLAGKALQALGLVLLPVGLYHGLVHDRGMTTELALLAGGALLFVLGSALVRGR
jgi:hypothetical protein